MKKILSVILCLVVAVQALSVRAKADAIWGTFGDGTWTDDYQCVRFSVFDLESAQTVSVLDMYRESYGNTLMRLINDSSFNNAFIHSIGCKFDYLLQSQRTEGSDFDKLTAIDLCNSNQVSYRYGIRILSGECSQQMKEYITPITCLDNNKWVAPQCIKELLKQEDTGVIDENILYPLGFYAFNPPEDDPDATYFTDNYILVIEPVFYFPVWRISDGRMIVFYGTATEYAIFDTQLDAKGIKIKTVKTYTGTIHNTMGNLTMFAGPASVMTPETKTFEMGTGEEITICKSPNPRSFFNTYNLSRGGYCDSTVNMRILNEFGVDTLRAREIKPLTLNISRNNQNFRCDTDVYLSFLLLNGSSEELFRDEYEQYEFKLVLETLSDSEIDPGSVTFATQGLPAAADDTKPASTYIFKEFRCPSSPGRWRFKAELYQSIDGVDEQIVYSTENGFKLDGDDMAYAFEIDFSKLDYKVPIDTSASDVMPKGFAVPSTAEMESSLTKVTHREWNYYKVSFNEINGEIKRSVTLVQDHADMCIDPDAEVNFYPNIPSLGYSEPGIKISRSGYGVGLCFEPIGNQAYSYQNGLAYYPESNFAESNYITLANGKYQLEKNPYSIYYSDSLKSDYSRVHFTPIWYPDVKYDIVVRMFDSWTPAGELSDYKVLTMQIQGTVYDDWHIVRK